MLSVISISTPAADEPRGAVLDQYAIHKVPAPQLQGRDIHRDAYIQQAGVMPFADVANCLEKDPFADIDDGTGLLEQRNEYRRLDDAVFGVLPTKQRFETLDLAALDIDLRLIVEQELVRDRGPG